MAAVWRFWVRGVLEAMTAFNGADGLIILPVEAAAVGKRDRNSGWAILLVGSCWLLGLDCRWINQAEVFCRRWGEAVGPSST